MNSKEPFLDDERIVFQQNFLLFDNTMNSAEVQYYHLRIPKTKLSEAPLQPTEPSLAPIPNSERPKGKLIDSSVLPLKEKVSSVLQPDIKPENTSLSPPRPRMHSPERNMPSPERNIPQPEENPRNSAPRTPTRAPEEKPRREEAPRRSNNESPKPERHAETKVLSVQDYWIKPLKNTGSCEYKLYNKGKEYKLVEDRQVILSARQTSTGFDIFSGNMKEFEIKMHNESAAYLVTVNEAPNREICAISFKNTSETSPILFQLYIPALKKRDGEHIIVPIEAGEESNLIRRVERKSKEVITLSTRVPNEKDGQMDFCFGDMFKVHDRNNFVLFHSSQPKRVVTSCGGIHEGVCRINSFYPTCPIQAFFASLAVHLIE